MRGFFAELKRRHVYRVAVIYAAVAWLAVQIADIVLENFNLPERVMQIVILCAALGFPVALVLAWLYDLSARGIQRTAMPGVVDVVLIPRFEKPYGSVGGVAVVADNTWTAQQALQKLNIEFEAGDNGSYNTEEYKQQLVKNVEAPAKKEFEKYYLVQKDYQGNWTMDNYGRADYLFLNVGSRTEPRFEDVSAVSGVRQVGHGLSCLWVDHDLDGDLDIYVANDFLVPDRFYRNDGAEFLGADGQWHAVS